MADSTDLAPTFDLPAAVQAYLDGTESIAEIAQRNKKCARTIYRWLLAGLGDERYHDLVTECLANRIADADIALAGAKDGLELGKAREMARFSRMDLERRRPALYGPKQETRHILPASLTISISHEPPALTIDHAPSELTPSTDSP